MSRYRGRYRNGREYDSDISYQEYSNNDIESSYTTDEYFDELSEEEQKEEARNIKNGINFAKKVLTTGECDLLILDEVLGLVDYGLIESEELEHLIHARVEETDLILTGWVLNDELRPYIDEIYHLMPED